ncbi:hypothetical protein D2S45_10315 [Prevotella intermedia]|uniref:Uncharacterized protein n=2 Tax=Prevotella intermedia TaxID=28131 RepID=A0A3R8HHG5_PREIN|nr:hypothetical protein D2S53_10870 [Prevotella intermedia]RRF86601.1 hypothetical protein D2S45_10315 [Prevotella intermedia]
MNMNKERLKERPYSAPQITTHQLEVTNKLMDRSFQGDHNDAGSGGEYEAQAKKNMWSEWEEAERETSSSVWSK